MLSYYIANRYFFSKNNEKLVSFISYFSLLGVMIGVASLIIVSSIMRGFHFELVKNIISLNSDIVVKGNHINESYVQEKLKGIDFIEKTIFVSINQALLVSQYSKTGALVYCITNKGLQLKNQVYKNINWGSGDAISRNEIIIGRELAEALGVFIGSNIQVVSSSTNTSILGQIPKIKSLRVAGIFHTGMYDYDSAISFINIEYADSLFEEGVNTIEIYSKNPNNSELYSKKLTRLLGGNFQVTHWKSINSGIINALNIERIAMKAILTLIIIVAAFNVVSSLFILVKDKSKEIAILKAMGLGNSHIIAIFVINGAMIGVIGTFLGVVLGLVFTYNINYIKALLEKMSGVTIFDSAIYFLSYLPAKVDLFDTIIISCISIMLCLLAAIYPAYKAASLNPAEIIKNN